MSVGVVCVSVGVVCVGSREGPHQMRLSCPHYELQSFQMGQGESGLAPPQRKLLRSRTSTFKLLPEYRQLPKYVSEGG